MLHDDLLKECPALAMFVAVADGCAKAMALEPTYSGLLLSQLQYGVRVHPPVLDDRKFKNLTANWTARGAEAVFVDTENGQKYQVTIEPITGEENG